MCTARVHQLRACAAFVGPAISTWHWRQLCRQCTAGGLDLAETAAHARTQGTHADESGTCIIRQPCCQQDMAIDRKHVCTHMPMCQHGRAERPHVQLRASIVCLSPPDWDHVWQLKLASVYAEAGARLQKWRGTDNWNVKGSAG